MLSAGLWGVRPSGASGLSARLPYLKLPSLIVSSSSICFPTGYFFSLVTHSTALPSSTTEARELSNHRPAADSPVARSLKQNEDDAGGFLYSHVPPAGVPRHDNLYVPPDFTPSRNSPASFRAQPPSTAHSLKSALTTAGLRDPDSRVTITRRKRFQGPCPTAGTYRRVARRPGDLAIHLPWSE